MDQTRRHPLVPLALGLALAACSGQLSIGDPEVELRTFDLVVDESEALQLQECTDALGAEACSRYKNPELAKDCQLVVMGDGAARLLCSEGGEIAPAPVVCALDDNGCYQCVDTGQKTWNSCDGSDVVPFSQPLRPSKFEVPDFVLPQAKEEAGSACVEDARARYANKINEILAAEGLTFRYALAEAAPELSGALRALGEREDNPERLIQRLERMCREASEMTECRSDDESAGRCYCEQDDDGPECRCARITSRALEEVCRAIPADCDTAAWARALWAEDAAATRWLDGGDSDLRREKAELLGRVPSFSDARGPGDITCRGSPLVLDLAGDGLALTSAAEGVRFDLSGRGPAPTSWIAGDDDALLAMDIDRDGLIRDAGELFGEISALRGGFTRDGFHALAALDEPARGGNADGRIDHGDRLFEQLRLWTDRNRDGVSQAAEIKRLGDAGIQSLDLRHTKVQAEDEHGNDLSLQGSFIRADGRTGLLVDVYFVNR